MIEEQKLNVGTLKNIFFKMFGKDVKNITIKDLNVFFEIDIPITDRYNHVTAFATYGEILSVHLMSDYVKVSMCYPKDKLFS